jgi:non-specific serine/threonine protein kinase
MPRLVAQALSNLICAVAEQGMGSRAPALAHQCLSLVEELNDAWALIAAIVALAVAAEAQSAHERAARLFGAADAMRLTQGAAMTPVLQRAAQRGRSAARLHLGDAGFEAAWQYGQVLSPAEAIQFALEC